MELLDSTFKFLNLANRKKTPSLLPNNEALHFVLNQRGIQILYKSSWHTENIQQACFFPAF